jgi:hypothetical protein
MVVSGAFWPVDWRIKVERDQSQTMAGRSTPTPGSHRVVHHVVLAKFRPSRRPTTPHWPPASGRVRESRGRSLGQQQLVDLLADVMRESQLVDADAAIVGSSSLTMGWRM